MIEKVVFFVLAFTILIITIIKFIKRKDKTYIVLMFLEIIGIVFQTSILNLSFSDGLWIIIISHFLSIIIPMVVFILEKKRIFISEVIGLLFVNMCLKAGNNEAARKRLIKIIDKYPNSYFAHRLLAKIYEKEGKQEYAIDEYVKLVELNPKDYDSYYKVALLLNGINKKEEAENMLNNLLEKKPEYYQASELLGSILYDLDKFSEAISVYQKALEFNPTRFELYYGIGMAYTRLNDFKVAKEYYEKAAALNSMLFHAKINLAQIALIMKDYDKAEDYLLECIQDEDSEGYAYYYLAITALRKGDLKRAIEFVNIAIELDQEIYALVQKREMFSIIKKYINEVDPKKPKHKYSKQEIKTRRYLDNAIAMLNNKNGEHSAKKKDDEKILENEQERYREE